MWRFQRFFNSIKPIQLFNRYYIYRKAFSTVLHIRTSTILLESLFTGKATGKFFHRVVTVTEKSEVASRRLGKLGGCKLSSGPLDRQKLQKIDWNPTKTTKIIGKIRQIFEKWVNIRQTLMVTPLPIYFTPINCHKDVGFHNEICMNVFSLLVICTLFFSRLWKMFNVHCVHWITAIG